MIDLLKKIYENVICYEEDTVKMGKRVDSEVDRLIEPFMGQFTDSEQEILKNLMYKAVLTAEQEGFQLGVQYSMRLMSSMLQD